VIIYLNLGLLKILKVDFNKSQFFFFFMMAVSPTIAFAADTVANEASKIIINSALGQNSNIVGFIAGMVCIGLVTSFNGPAGMFVASAFCSGSFVCFLKK
jgi:hypothetical protein